MMKIRVLLLTSVFLVTAAMADDKPKLASGKETEVTGCLTKGEPAGHYWLTTKSGRKIEVTGSADLEKHAQNHTVRLTGRRTSKVFNATAVEHISETCEVGKAEKKKK